MKRVAVGRHINGITINPLEYLLDDEGDLMTFESEEKAKEFLTEKGFSEEDMYWMVFEEVDDVKQTDEYEVIGKCEVDENGEIIKLEREYFRQGYIYKNPNAYHNDKSAVCYVPELSDSLYTGQDFLDMCNGQPEIADHVFDAVDWQHPESYLDEQGDDELWQCKCGKWYWCYGVDKCPYCGAEKKEENYAG